MKNKENPFKNLVAGAKPQAVTTPTQSSKKGVVKPIEKTFLLSLPEHKIMALKKLAVDKKTNVRNLINIAIDKEYFNI